MKKRVLIVGAGTFQWPLIERCSQLCDVLVAAPVIPDHIKPFIVDSIGAEVREYEKILSFALGNNKDQLPIDGVLTDQTDIPVLTVARIGEAMDLPCIDHATAHLFTDKSLMRKRMIEMGIKTLPYEITRSLDEARQALKNLDGVVIIKPVDTQGSRGVQVCHSLQELEAKYEEAARWASDASGNAVIVERYATGREFVVEGLALNYDFWNLTIGDTLYFNIEDSFSAKERTFPTVADNELRDRVLELNYQIVKGFNLKQGLTHSEFIMNGDDIFLMETAARGGGAFISSDLIHPCCGLDTAELLLKLALGELQDPTDIPVLMDGDRVVDYNELAQKTNEHCGYLAFYVPEGTVQAVRGVDKVRALSYVHRTQLDGIENLIGTTVQDKHTDKTSRYLVTIVASSRKELEERMAFVRSTIEMDILTPDGRIIGLIWQ